MIISVFPSGMFATNAMVIACERTKAAAIVDPAPESHTEILSFLKENSLVPAAIYLTHSHWDHIADVAILKQELKIPVWIHPEDAQNLKKPGSDGLPQLIHIEPATPDHLFNEGMKLDLGDLKIEVIHTPGHSPGGVCLYIPEEKLLLSGDTLFQGSIGNLSFPTAEPARMWHSLKKLAPLPPETKVYPGHGAVTTIGEESWLPNAEKYFG